jgi:hypothetical protein
MLGREVRKACCLEVEQNRSGIGKLACLEHKLAVITTTSFILEKHAGSAGSSHYSLNPLDFTDSQDVAEHACAMARMLVQTPMPIRQLR